MIDAIILAGGKGSRMEDELPKPLIKARGKEILFWQMDYLADKVDKITVSAGYMPGMIIETSKNRYGKDNPRIIYAPEYFPLGTAGGLKNAMKELNKVSRNSHALVLNCDDIANVDVEVLYKTAVKDDMQVGSHARLPYSKIKEGDGGYITYVPYPMSEDWISCGWYMFRKHSLDDMLKKHIDKKGSLEEDVFPKAKLKLYKHEGFWKALNSKKDLEEFANMEIPKGLLNSAEKLAYQVTA